MVCTRFSCRRDLDDRTAADSTGRRTVSVDEPRAGVAVVRDRQHFRCDRQTSLWTDPARKRCGRVCNSPTERSVAMFDHRERA